MDTVEFLSSPLLSAVPGLTHGFGKRIAGTRAVARNAARTVLASAGEVYFLRQVHGATIVTTPWSEPPDADGSFTDSAGVILAIETADCLPVLIVDPVKRRVAAAHAGWRGTVAHVAQRAALALIATGSRAEDLLASLGPAMGACCYEVGPDVEDAFGPEGARFFVPGRAERKNLDKVAANRAQLEAAGLKPTNIDSLNLCTRDREDMFFSYRRDGANAGRMISVVGFSI
ncbi:MAG: peptidoglycan editing factor PgeF [Vicinamibacteria bacterium]